MFEQVVLKHLYPDLFLGNAKHAVPVRIEREACKFDLFSKKLKRMAGNKEI
jgi:hypothetical protein